MTEETKLALQQAMEALATASADADREKEACLAQIAADLPARVADSAKRVAMAQPDVTTVLGKTKVDEMRAELKTAAEELGRSLAATDDVRWPLGSKYTPVRTYSIHSALFDRLYHEASDLSYVMRSRGYIADASNFTPQSMYDEPNFTSLAEALTVLGRAQEQVEEARKNDDSSSAEDIWGE
ncbi:hypothetical protein [Clavibacter zhangzhiyongii]|uniref:hypothetical protein n=1 Tax=Clavibacter zhangzhiyongii TaxID=2768071 RepID=UPI001958D1C3|nr:hypothetical protein [Clavibacter zhangzhiyongii]MBM7025433.1 hypothetical protein [Clavibacter zhangzhiyongii]